MAVKLEDEGNVEFDVAHGLTPSGVPAYSNGSDAFFSGERNYVDGVVTGYKWQCVEFARRWLLKTKGCVFADVMRASEIWSQSVVTSVETGAEHPLRAMKNGGTEPPVAGTLIIYPFMEKEVPWGHVGIITHVDMTEMWAGVGEQNENFISWEGRCYGRKVPIQKRDDGTYFLADTILPPCLGWMLPELPDRADTHAPLNVMAKFITPRVPGTLERNPVAPTVAELDLSVKSEALYAERPAGKAPWTATYIMSEALGTDNVAAVNAALRMIRHCVSHVLHEAGSGDLARFDVPPELVDRFRNSWKLHSKVGVLGRIDMAFDGKQTKLLSNERFESITMTFQCSALQDRWVKQVFGQGPPFSMSKVDQDTVDGFKRSLLFDKDADTIHFVHAACDDVVRYNFQYVFEVANKATQQTDDEAPYTLKQITLDSVKFVDGVPHDADGVRIRIAYKNVSWKAILAEYRATKMAGPLAKLFLSEDVLVLEPLWKYLAAHPAVLPLLRDQHPDSEYLRLYEFDAAGAVVLNPSDTYDYRTADGHYPVMTCITHATSFAAFFITDGTAPDMVDEGPLGPVQFQLKPSDE